RAPRPPPFPYTPLFRSRLPLRARRVVARLSNYRWIPGDRVLRDRFREPDRREAWIRDQYRHVEEHRHTLGEVRGWFRDVGITWLDRKSTRLNSSHQIIS